VTALPDPHSAIDFAPGPQSGGREPAPGELGLVQAFVNTHWDLELDHGGELLHSPAALAGWLAARRLLPDGARLARSDLRRALAVREGIRAMLAANNGSEVNDPAVRRLNEAVARAGVVIQFSGDGRPRFDQQRLDLDGALAFLLSTVARAQLEGSWQRFKSCPGDDCGWAFYDYSRNQASAWCSMAICGSRAKARSYRRRRRLE
jgi:predicted RNA-binding Zn ribbon-like protein